MKKNVKMCPNREKFPVGFCPYSKPGGSGCPKNTGGKCEIITPKKKVKKVSKKMWALFYPNGKFMGVLPKKAKHWESRPCTITYTAKKGEKK